MPGSSRTVLSLLATLAFAAPAFAAGAGPAPCSAPECRQFDFWIGDWNVENAKGDAVGTNHIEKILDGCVLMENWSGARGSNGKSFNLWSVADSKWHQTWVDNQGSLLELSGAFANGRMILEGASAAANGATVRNRITWTPIDADRVEQHWEVSADGGKNWQDAFWGLYRRKTGSGGKK